MKSIITKYVPPTNTKGARIIAKAEGVPSVTVGYHDNDGNENPHAIAAKKLKDKMGWSGKMVGGTLPNGSMAWVFADDVSINPRPKKFSRRQLRVWSKKSGKEQKLNRRANALLARKSVAVMERAQKNPRKPPSVKQLAARAKFVAMARAKAKRRIIRAKSNPVRTYILCLVRRDSSRWYLMSNNELTTRSADAMRFVSEDAAIHRGRELKDKLAKMKFVRMHTIID